MNAFELGFFSELEKLATVEDGTLSFPKKKIPYGFPSEGTSRHHAQDLDTADQDGRVAGSIIGAAAPLVYDAAKGGHSAAASIASPATGFMGALAGGKIARGLKHLSTLKRLVRANARIPEPVIGNDPLEQVSPMGYKALKDRAIKGSN